VSECLLGPCVGFGLNSVPGEHSPTQTRPITSGRARRSARGEEGCPFGLRDTSVARSTATSWVTAFDPTEPDEIAHLLGKYHRLYTQLEAVVSSFQDRTRRVESGEHVPVAEFEVILKEAIPIIDERMIEIAGRQRSWRCGRMPDTGRPRARALSPSMACASHVGRHTPRATDPQGAVVVAGDHPVTGPRPTHVNHATLCGWPS
jgi:hypothetical protein